MSKSVKVVIIHGSYGSPEENWFPWLASEIRKLGHEALVPCFPTPEGQNLRSWLKVFKAQVGVLEPNMILVGHSLGSGFILCLLEQTKVSVLGTFLVSGFLGSLGNPEFDVVNKTFVSRRFDWSHIRYHAGMTQVFNSDNDPYVPIQKGHELARRLGVDLTVIKGGGHINAESGYLSFQILLDKILNLIR
jgi:predicted alpha/beta hydrolase family esterase